MTSRGQKSQRSKESLQSFILRAIELLKRLLTAGTEDRSEGSYKPEMIQKRILRMISSGLLSDSIKFMLKPYLDDEVLIEKTSEAANWAARVMELQAEEKRGPEGKKSP
ncbi:UNVERIFIED_CONTAM: hypothetical protein FKN15_060907 [Acipenser sinensis]